MAILTSVGCVDVRRIFSGGVDSIVAGRAIARDAGVIELGVIPRVGVVTIIAGIGARDVISRFALSGGSVVA